MNERQTDRQPNRLRKMGMAGTMALTGLLGAPIAASFAEAATCPAPIFRDVAINGENVTISKIKRAIITGDVEINHKGIFRDNDPLTGELIIVEFPAFTDLAGVDAKFGGNVREYVSCTTNTQFNNAVGAMERTQLANKPSDYIEQTHRVTTP